MLQKDPSKRLSASQLLKHEFLVKNVKQFQPMDVRKVPGTVTGGMINLNSNSGVKGGNLGQTVWDIFNQPGINQQPARPGQNMGMPMPQMQVPGQQMYGMPQPMVPGQQYMAPGAMPQMQMGYH